jgi:sulfate transport system ATP-binding protein/putative spermidine/putrescine transport system ATP-binding protein
MSWVKNLKHHYQDFDLDIDEWEILDHGITVLWGSSGAGKSTLIRVLVGLEQNKIYQWMWGQEDLAQKSPGEKRLGVVFQDNLLFPHMTALENIEFAARCRKMSKNNFKLKTELWFQKLDMNPFLHKKCVQLSGGEKQRTALLQAMITSPRLLILDEPFSALNEELRNESREVVKELVSLEKIPVLLVTHDQKDVDMLGTKVTHIQKGKIIADNKL